MDKNNKSVCNSHCFSLLSMSISSLISDWIIWGQKHCSCLHQYLCWERGTKKKLTHHNSLFTLLGQLLSLQKEQHCAVLCWMPLKKKKGSNNHSPLCQPWHLRISDFYIMTTSKENLLIQTVSTAELCKKDSSLTLKELIWVWCSLYVNSAHVHLLW